jgi:hypothetical protein
MDQKNRIEDPEINSDRNSHLIFDKCSKNIHWRKDILFIKWFLDIWISTCRRMEWEAYLTLFTKINLNWIDDLSVRHKTLQLPDKNTWIYRHRKHSWKYFNCLILRATIHKWDCSKWKSLNTAKDTIAKLYKNLQNVRKIFSSIH